MKLQMSALYIFLCGGLGATMRYILSEILNKFFGTTYPWGTFLVNSLGCFLLGIVYAVLTYHNVNSFYKVIITTGFLGGFTTFSAFAGEVFSFINNKEIGIALLYIASTNCVAIISVFVGFKLGALILNSCH